MSVLDGLSLAAQHREHEAWLDFVKEWQSLFPTTPMNDKVCDPLVRSIEVWGERLVALRLRQTEETRANALQYKLDSYVQAKGETR